MKVAQRCETAILHARIIQLSGEAEIRISDLFALTAISASYAALYSVDDFRVACVAICLLGLALLWILIAPSTISHVDDQYRKLRCPWFIFGCGIVFLFAGVFLYLPNAVSFATESFWDAVSKGYDDHFEESETIGLAVIIGLILFGFPAVLIAGTIGAVCSAHFKIQGVGRYSTAFALAMMPLVVGSMPAVGYLWTAYRLSNEG